MSDLHDELDQALEEHFGTDADLPPTYSDEALTRRYTTAFKDKQRWVELWGKWMIWTGTHWCEDDRRNAVYRARQIATQASADFLKEYPNSKNGAEKIASSKTIMAIERLARSSPEFATRTDEWDSDLWLFNTPGGTVDLRTGGLRYHDPQDLITRVATATPKGHCPRFLSFLTETFGDDDDTIAFIQRLLGYALTGTCQEHMLAFCYGTGGNGKGVLLNTVQRIFGSYAATAAVETFTRSTYERHSTDLAMLRGRRLVLAQETDDGQRWAEAKIKSITGGDEITARYMRQDNFTFLPQFTLIIAGNHKPSLQNVDEAIKRRLIMIPFDHTVPANRRDPKLVEALEAEWPGILAWMIQGCLEWQRNTLNPSAAARAATKDYLLEEDALGRFLEEECESSGLFGGTETPTRALFQHWQEWCQSVGEASGTEKRFSQRLSERGFERAQTPNTRRSIFRGLRLRTTKSE